MANLALASNGRHVTAVCFVIFFKSLTYYFFQVDSNLMEGLIFPRAAALAERLWTNPEEGYLQSESRMFQHRDRLVRHGVRAMAITPTFCLQNQEACFGEEEEKV